MRGLKAALPVLLLALPLLALAQQQQPNYAISGTVVQHLTGKPLKHARVTIQMNERPDRKASLFTGDDGRFQFTDVPAGKFTLAAEWHGAQHLYQQDDEQFSTGIVTGPAQDTTHIVFDLPAPTHLDVDVIDDENEPVRACQVTLIRRTINSGWPQMRQFSQESTDAEGVAHFAHLNPGTYYIAVSGRPWYAQNVMNTPGMAAETAAELNKAYPVTYYGNVQEAAAAVPLQIAEGERAHVQITLRAVPAARILLRGRAEENDPAHGFRQIQVAALGPGGVPITTQSQSFQQGGEWEVSGVAPGSYVLSSSHFGPQGGMPRALSSTRVTAGAETTLDDSEFIRTSVTGQLTVEGGEANGLNLFLLQPANQQNAFCQVRQKGEFTCRGQMSGLAPGWYEIRLASNELYPKSVTVQGARYQGGLLEVTEGATIRLAITAARGLSNIGGIALDQTNRPLSGAMVLLVPQDGDMTKGIPRDQSDSDGTFTLPNVQPGRYFVIAIDHGHDLAYHNQQVLARYLTHAQQVEIPLARGVDRVRVQVQKR